MGNRFTLDQGAIRGSWVQIAADQHPTGGLLFHDNTYRVRAGSDYRCDEAAGESLTIRGEDWSHSELKQPPAPRR